MEESTSSALITGFWLGRAASSSPSLQQRKFDWTMSSSSSSTAYISHAKQRIAVTIDVAMLRRHEFTQSSPLRTFRLVVEGLSLYVNPYYLAELSPYFEKLFFNDFRESQDQCVEFATESCDDVIIFLDCVCATANADRCMVTENNAAILIRYADIWQVASLADRCEAFLTDRYPLIEAEFENAIDILCSAAIHRISQKGIANAIARLAFFGTERLIEAKLCDKLTDTKIVAALFSAAAVVIEETNDPLTDIDHLWNHGEHCKRECSILNCHSRRLCLSCTKCQLAFCSNHRSTTECLPRSSTAKESSRSKNTAVDHIKVTPYRMGMVTVNEILLV